MNAQRFLLPDACIKGSEVLAELRGVHKRYGATHALGGVDLQLRRGELLALLGPNGAGKTSAVSLWLGLTRPDQGCVRLLGRDPSDLHARRCLGVMMQEAALAPELKVRELIEETASFYPAPLSTDETLRLTGTQAIAGRPYNKLSGGQKRQAQFALAVCGRPQVLFLDEPTVGLDVDARENLWSTIRALVAQGSSVLLTTHYLEEAQALADRVAVLARGKLIAQGSVDEIRSVVDRRRIRCTSTLAAEAVRDWPGVTQATREAQHLQITATQTEEVVRRLLAADASLRDLEVRPADLADAFVEIIKEAA